MAKRKSNKYYVIDIDTCRILGTHPLKDHLKKCKRLYTGTNLKKANQTQKKYNSGKSKFADNRASIYAGVGDSERIFLHKY